MSQKQRTRDHFRTELESARANLVLIEQLEKLNPGFEVVLVAKSGSNGHIKTGNGQAKATPKTSPPKSPTPTVALSIRDKVASATRGKWATLEQIIAATGLTKDQIYGVIAGRGSKDDFDRQLAPGEPEHGKKQYKLKEKK